MENEGVNVTKPQPISGMRNRLIQATAAERGRLCDHLGVPNKSDIDAIEQAYLDAADNSIFNAVRSVIHSDAPTYSKALRLIYKEMRSYAEALDESWQRVKSIKFWQYKSPIEALTDSELEERILKIYEAEYAVVKNKLTSDPGMWRKLTSYVPGVGGVAAGTAVSASAYTALRLPFTGAAPGMVAGPVGVGLAVVFLGAKLAGPAYRKIIPATVEIMLIGKRIANTPQE